METQKSVGAIIFLIVGVGIAVMTLILVGAMSGLTYNMVEPDINEIGTDAYTTDYWYNETFQSPDANGANPSETWYVYGDTGGSGIAWENVTDLTGNAGSSQSYSLNTSTDAIGGALFDLVDRSYESFKVDVKIDNTSHNYSIVTIGSWYPSEEAHGAIAYWNMTTDTVSFFVMEDPGLANWTEVYNFTMANNTWYRLWAEFDYDTHIIHSQLWDETGGIAGIPIKRAEGNGTATLSFTNITQSYWSIPALHAADSCYIFHDDFDLLDTVTTPADDGVTIRTNIKDSIVSSMQALAATGSYLPIIVIAIIIIIILTLVIGISSITGNKISLNSKKGNAGAL